MKKLIDFQSSSLVDRIQRYANDVHNGNFNKAVRDLACKSLPLAKDEPKAKTMVIEGKPDIMSGLGFLD